MDLIDYFLFILGKFSTIISSKFFSYPYFFPFSFWDSYNSNVGGFDIVPEVSGASLVAQLVKNLPAMRETWVRSLGWEDPLEKGKATWPGVFQTSILAWRIPWTV